MKSVYAVLLVSALSPKLKREERRRDGETGKCFGKCFVYVEVNAYLF
jgi:hypothetical protein